MKNLYNLFGMLIDVDIKFIHTEYVWENIGHRLCEYLIHNLSSKVYTTENIHDSIYQSLKNLINEKS